MREPIEIQRRPSEQTPIIGYDQALERRPGVPMETVPRVDSGAHWRIPERQRKRTQHYRRRGLRELTPVFGTAQPPRGVSGLMRRLAYRIPEHKARHWMLLLAADRVDVLEGRLGEALARPLRLTPLAGLGDTVEKNPLRVIGAAAAGLVLSGVLIRRALD